MIRWDDIPTAAKMSAAAVTVILSTMAYLTTYQTDAEAQQWQQGHETETNLWRQQEVEEQIRKVQFQLLSENLSEQEREFLDAELLRLSAKLQCIRAGQC